MYFSFLGISGALHLGIFQQPAQQGFFSNLLECESLVFRLQQNKELGVQDNPKKGQNRAISHS